MRGCGIIPGSDRSQPIALDLDQRTCTELNSPNPALVTQRAAQRLPRVALLLLCAAYVIPGVLGRDPWKNADITAFGYMANIAQGRTSWLAPTVGGLPGDAALLPYWLGATFIKLLGPWLDPEVAARIPFALLLVLTLVLTWYCTYHLARTEAAQPLPFAFGGEASPVDYARAIAALIASLGLLQLGHETTPELAQLASVALFVYALAASPFRGPQAKLAVLVALPALAASGAPAIALALGGIGSVICRASGYDPARRFVPWIVASALLSAAAAFLLGAWGWRVSAGVPSPEDAWELVRLVGWFSWPAWPLATWTLWRWREHLSDRHIAIPLGCALVSLLACIAMGGSDRALMLGLPPLAVLAAFALPTLQRSTAAAIDWFSVCLFTVCAATIWVIYCSMQTGVPAQPAVNIERLSPGYVHGYSPFTLALAVLGTLAWLWLVKWRTGRTRHPLWKSLVLPASGVALCWLLVMTLLLPPVNNARSYRSLVQRIARRVPAGSCIAVPGLQRAPVVALEHFGGYRVDALTPADATRCEYLLQAGSRSAPGSPGAGWKLLARERRNTSDDEWISIYRRGRAGAESR
jgi:4-amino-4-deoxy-L-arabinose transferase-like glycosyltransferase